MRSPASEDRLATSRALMPTLVLSLCLSLCLLAMQVLGLMHSVRHGVRHGVVQAVTHGAVHAAKHGALHTDLQSMAWAGTAATEGLDPAAPKGPATFAAHEAGSADCTLLDHLLLGHGTVTTQAAVPLHALADSPPRWRGTAPPSAAHAAPQARGPPRV